MKTLKICFAALLSLFNSAVFAQNSAISASFVDIGFGARPVSMGNAFVGLADDVNAAYWNPAGLSSVTGVNATFTHTKQFGMVDYQYFAFSTPLNSDRQALGLAVVSSGNDLLRELSLHAAYSYRWNWLQFGLAGKWRNATFGKNTFNPDGFPIFDDDEIEFGRANQVVGYATGFGLDFGLLGSLTEHLKFGLMIRDLTAPLGWRSHTKDQTLATRGVYDENLPMEVITGLSYVVKNVKMVADYRPSLGTESSDMVRVGAEVTLLNVLSLRGGTQQSLNTLKDEKYMAGIGFHLPPTQKFRLFVDYTFMMEEIANTHRFSIAFKF